jgi:hypothetical protein
LARWISPDSAGVIAGLNLYVYVGNTGLVWDLGVVFAAFAEDVGANVQGGTLLFCLVN